MEHTKQPTHPSLLRQHPGLIKVREQAEHLARRLRTGEKEVEVVRKEAEGHAARVAALEAQLEQLEEGEEGGGRGT
jgi:hypothetical protein